MKGYLIKTIGLLLFATLLVAGFNVWADPYAIYRYGSADTDRISRLDQVFNMRLSKPWQVVQGRPDALVIGSSRSGVVPPGFSAPDGRSAYNLSMPGLTLYEMLRLIQHANAHGRLSRLTIGLEFETFITGEPRVGLGFEEGRLAGAEPALSAVEIWPQLARDVWDTLFTAHTTTRSIQALSGKALPPLRFRHDGSWHNRSNIWLGRTGYVMVGENLVSRKAQPDESLEANLEIFSRILEYLHRQGIDTRLYLSPEHLFLVDLKRHLELHSRWEDFHRQLIAVNATTASETGRKPFPLWGFNQLDGVVNEPLPRREGSLDDWFRDGIHFREELGANIMQQLWEGADVGGLQLDETTLGSYLGQVEALRQQFVSSQPRRVLRYRDKILIDRQPLQEI